MSDIASVGDVVFINRIISMENFKYYAKSGLNTNRANAIQENLRIAFEKRMKFYVQEVINLEKNHPNLVGDFGGSTHAYRIMDVACPAFLVGRDVGQIAFIPAHFVSIEGNDPILTMKPIGYAMIKRSM